MGEKAGGKLRLEWSTNFDRNRGRIPENNNRSSGEERENGDVCDVFHGMRRSFSLEKVLKNGGRLTGHSIGVTSSLCYGHPQMPHQPLCI